MRRCSAPAGMIDQDEAGKICGGLEQISAGSGVRRSADRPLRRGYPYLYRGGELTQRLGDAGKRLHTARSRNDQVALDVRLICGSSATPCTVSCRTWYRSCVKRLPNMLSAVMPGYTHLQRAQPSLLAII